MYGAHSSIGRLWYNQSAAALGNIVGGAIFIGLIEHLLNHWKSPIFRSHHPHDGTLLGHDIESTRRARDTRDTHPHRHQPCPEIKVDDTTGSRRMSQEATDTELQDGMMQRGGPQAEIAAESGAANPEHQTPSIWRAMGRSSHEKKDATDNV